MKTELALKGLSIDYLKECFYIKDWVLYGKDRKQEHFKTEKGLVKLYIKLINLSWKL